ncbi:hypothetical protein C8A05DRAFT_20275 [Staphylotrichum tortipilum]|uniref:Succinate dehydrogenase assembly factor 4, mitochondrial n=1 Tax=Staphylotrichum tortipilum TaxID=2831512 RepID=A0AAN6M9Q5_9PEZI|nr:hypothetical protein C8A05DRAFT_20275 [Staphylotrichum longicolle]
MSRLLRPLTRLPRPTPLLPRLSHRPSSFLQSSPSPPRLPADQQAEFERLQRAAEAALSSHTAIPTTPDPPLATSRHVTQPTATSPSPSSPQEGAAVKAQGAGQDGGDGGESISAGSLSGGVRRGAPPEFEGERNPATGEVGGPKNEPLRWGSGGDWSFNGRCTDF